MGFYVILDKYILLLSSEMFHLMIEIFSVKTSDNNVGILQFQDPCYVIFYHFCCGGSEGTDDRIARQLFHKIYDF